MKIRTYAHGDPELWGHLGPFLADRKVHQELGGPIYSTEGVTWFVAIERGKAVGFASLRQTKTARHYDYDYVVPGKRGTGIHAALCEVRDKVAGSGSLPRRVVVRESRWHHYESRGWRLRSRRGSWVTGEVVS